MVFLKVGKDRGPDLGWKYRSCELRRSHCSLIDGNSWIIQLTKLSKEIESSRRGEKENVGEGSEFALRIRMQGLHPDLNPEPLLQHPSTVANQARGLHSILSIHSRNMIQHTYETCL